MTARDSAATRVVGPGFNDKVYDVVRSIPPGTVCTYGQIATVLGSPRVARHVGWALAALVGQETEGPWHRVINARGRISHRGDTLRAEEQYRRLCEEGVVFSSVGVIDLNVFRWTELI